MPTIEYAIESPEDEHARILDLLRAIEKTARRLAELRRRRAEAQGNDEVVKEQAYNLDSNIKTKDQNG